MLPPIDDPEANSGIIASIYDILRRFCMRRLMVKLFWTEHSAVIAVQSLILRPSLDRRRFDINS